jgi:2-polyprenyl-6-methoxyphenol hydroxylase-like FAD-dependent oxidoreductase
MQMPSVRVVIVGGGIGGLSAALALRSAGADVRVYEQAAEIGEVGAGVGLFPNSIRILPARRRRCGDPADTAAADTVSSQ